MNATGDAARIVRFWHAVEMFSPQKLPDPDVRVHVADVHPGEPMPWEPGSRLNSQSIRPNQPGEQFDLDDTVVLVRRCSPPDDVVIAERKGWGHPDTLADHLAERLSRAYSRYTLSEFGAVLHHNFDKLALLGGSCEVRYGRGLMTSPVRVLVNGRAARSCGGSNVPVEDLINHEVRSFIRHRLPGRDSGLQAYEQRGCRCA